MEQLRGYNNKLAESEERFRTVANALPVKIWMSDKKGDNPYFNQRFLTFMGKTMDEASAGDWTEHIHVDDQPSYRQVYQEAYGRQKPFEVECRLKCHDNEYRWMMARGVPRFKGGELIGYIGSLLDITSLKESQQALPYRF